jgi:hypothetical protein
MTYQHPCDHCGGLTSFATEIAPLGSEPGRRVFFCDLCNRTTWTTWRITQQPQKPAKKK